MCKFNCLKQNEGDDTGAVFCALFLLVFDGGLSCRKHWAAIAFC